MDSMLPPWWCSCGWLTAHSLALVTAGSQSSKWPELSLWTMRSSYVFSQLCNSHIATQSPKTPTPNDQHPIIPQAYHPLCEDYPTITLEIDAECIVFPGVSQHKFSVLTLIMEDSTFQISRKLRLTYLASYQLLIVQWVSEIHEAPIADFVRVMAYFQQTDYPHQYDM
ncbi:hypothetical protein OG21DRAFT_1527011 [Imleria badia]|nr:hypothetical protein OG21DRAFT_1527011 [Imleria badia]